MPETVQRPDERLLTADYAAHRAGRISQPEYDLKFVLEEDPEHFSGRAAVGFRLTEVDESLTIDFTDGEIHEFVVNGTALAAAYLEEHYNGAFVRLPAEHLVVGDNRIEMTFRHPYSRTGQGLHRFVDPADDRIYVHSHFEPYDANRLFPCFDQPDLKAVFTLEVDAPSGWQVVSATREHQIVAAGPRKLWRFPPTRPISTYILPLHAGEYRLWGSRAGDIPLRLFARHSLGDHVQAESWFDLTRRGFEFFERYFDLPYPYGKYDQLIVPEFNIGAMENVAAVTFSESFVRRGRYTREDMEGLTNTLLHEMSHMWFGDLVTPRWWDGLWLKEAFATYMGYLGQAEATPYADAWHLFFVTAKQRAYVADQRVTTHPVQVPVDDTHYAFANFDDITYRKGSSVLTQLSHYVGQDAFRDGVRAYLRTHADGATSLADFMSELERAANVSLDGWIDEWLETPGVNSLTAEITTSDGLIEHLVIHQSAPDDYPRLRSHRLQVGLYSWEDDRFVPDVLTVNVQDEQTVVETAAGRPSPELILPNHGDWTFARAELDPVTAVGLSDRQSRIPDPLLRSMFWAALWDQVREGTLGLNAFLDMVANAVPGEANDKVIRLVTSQLGQALGYLWRLPPTQRVLLDRYGPQLEQLVWHEATGAPAGSDIQALWIDTYRRIAHTPEALDRLYGFLDGAGVPGGYSIDQDRRWLLLRRLAGFVPPAGDDADQRIEELLEAERRRDPTDGGQTAALAVEASRPEAAVKRRWLERIRNPASELSLYRRRSVIGALFPVQQAALHESFTEDLLDSLGPVGANHQDPFLKSYGMLLPQSCRPDSATRLARVIEEMPALHPLLDEALRVAQQEDERCQRISQRLGMGDDLE